MLLPYEILSGRFSGRVAERLVEEKRMTTARFADRGMASKEEHEIVNESLVGLVFT